MSADYNVIFLHLRFRMTIFFSEHNGKLKNVHEMKLEKYRNIEQTKPSSILPFKLLDIARVNINLSSIKCINTFIWVRTFG